MGNAKTFIPFGIDSHQRRARDAAGIETRPPLNAVREKLVLPLVTYQCAHCGCTNAWASDAKKADKVCAWCGKAHEPIHYPSMADRLWVKDRGKN